MTIKCPLCHSEFPADQLPLWRPDVGVFISGVDIVVFTGTQTAMFDLLWKGLQSGKPVVEDESIIGVMYRYGYRDKYRKDSLTTIKTLQVTMSGFRKQVFKIGFDILRKPEIGYYLAPTQGQSSNMSRRTNKSGRPSISGHLKPNSKGRMHYIRKRA